MQERSDQIRSSMDFDQLERSDQIRWRGSTFLFDFGSAICEREREFDEEQLEWKRSSSSIQWRTAIVREIDINREREEQLMRDVTLVIRMGLSVC